MKVRRLSSDGRVTQVYRVLQAIDRGCASTQEIADAIGLSTHKVSAYLAKLRTAGYIRSTGPADGREGHRGAAGFSYELACGKREATV